MTRFGLQIPNSRLGTPVVTGSPEETERTTGFLGGMAGDAFGGSRSGPGAQRRPGP